MGITMATLRFEAALKTALVMGLLFFITVQMAGMLA